MLSLNKRVHTALRQGHTILLSCHFMRFLLLPDMHATQRWQESRLARISVNWRKGIESAMLPELWFACGRANVVPRVLPV